MDGGPRSEQNAEAEDRGYLEEVQKSTYRMAIMNPVQDTAITARRAGGDGSFNIMYPMINTTEVLKTRC